MTHETTRQARLMQVIETVSIRGAGTEADPVREVRQYWSCNEMHPELLAERDMYRDTQYIEKAQAHS